MRNDARSQMAEAFLNQLGEESFEGESAGVDPGEADPLAELLMKEIGFELNRYQPKEIFDLFKKGRHYHAVINISDENRAEKSPIFPGMSKRLTWSVQDPASFSGNEEELKEQTRKIRDQIRAKVFGFIAQASDLNYWVAERKTDTVAENQ